MDQEKKQKIKEVIKKHLEALGWPHIPKPDEFIMSQLKPIFKTLLLMNLVKYHEWDAFYLAAERQYTLAKIREHHD